MDMTYNGIYYGWLLFAVTYGIMEARIYTGGFKTRGDRLLGFFSKYHILMFLIFLIAMRENWYLLPIMFVVEDLTYFIAHPRQYLNKNSWVNFGLGGCRIFGQWIPVSYLVGLGVFGVTYYINNLIT